MDLVVDMISFKLDREKPFAQVLVTEEGYPFAELKKRCMLKHKTLGLMLAGSLLFTACSQTAQTPISEGTTKAPSPEGTTETHTSQEGDSAISESTTVKSKAPNKVTNLLADPDALAAAQAELENLPKFKGKQIQIFQTVHFSTDNIRLSLQDPENPENIDQYTFREGAWAEPAPVRITGDGNMADNVHPLKKDFLTIPAKIYKTWNEKAREVGAPEGDPTQAFGGGLSSISYVFNIVNGSLSWSVSDIENERNVYDISFDLNGDLKNFAKK